MQDTLSPPSDITKGLLTLDPRVTEFSVAWDEMPTATFALPPLRARDCDLLINGVRARGVNGFRFWQDQGTLGSVRVRTKPLGDNDFDYAAQWSSLDAGDELRLIVNHPDTGEQLAGLPLIVKAAELVLPPEGEKYGEVVLALELAQ